MPGVTYQEYLDLVKEGDEEAKKHKIKLLVAVQEQRSRMGKAVQTSLIYSLAARYNKFDKFYFVYTVDWRGRIYASQSLLNPQGVDFAKGLLEFAEGATINPQTDLEAMKWLKINIANKYGLDKKPFQERIEWVDSNTELLLQIAENPSNTGLWEDTDKPFQFLASVLEYAEYLKAPDKPFITRQPIHMDGTCNGLQHFSALLMDKEAGALVNMVPNDAPKDIYSYITEEVIKQVKWDSTHHEDQAKRVHALWLIKNNYIEPANSVSINHLRV
jgi:DNA-directed RNA polymerase